MPRLIHTLPKYRRHRASGQAMVTINGVDHYLGRWGTKASEREYDRLITEWLSSGRSTSFGAAAHSLTIVELAADYVRYAKTYYGTEPSSELHRIVRVVRPLRELYGRMPAVEFGVLEFKAIRQRLIDGGLTGSTLADNVPGLPEVSLKAMRDFYVRGVEEGGLRRARMRS